EAASQLTGPEQGAWLSRLNAEHANLLAALAHGAVTGDRGQVLRLTAALWRFWLARGHFVIGRQAVDEALGLDATREPTRARAETLLGGAAPGFPFPRGAKGAGQW